MTISECYKNFGGNYESVLGRLGSEALIKKFLVKFLDDASFKNIFSKLESGNNEEAFRAAHTLKGVCQNLGLDRLYGSSCTVTDALRNGKNNVTEAMLDTLKKDYEITTEAIKKLD